MKNKLLTGLVTVGFCIVAIPVACFLLALNLIWAVVDRVVRLLDN